MQTKSNFLKRFFRNGKYALSYVANSAIIAATYKINFLIAASANVIHYIISLATRTFIFNRFQSIDGWSREEIILLYSLSLIPFSIFGIFFQKLSNFSSLVLEGGLDRYTLRPRSIFGQLLLEGFNPLFLTHFMLALFIFIFAYRSLALSFGLLEVAMTLVSAVSGVIIMTSLAIISSAVSLLTLNSAPFFQMLIYSPREMSWYPASIYPSAIGVTIMTLIPLAAFNYLPASVILKKSSYFEPFELIMFLVTLSFTFAILSSLIWRKARRHYSSVGS